MLATRNLGTDVIYVSCLKYRRVATQAGEKHFCNTMLSKSIWSDTEAEVPAGSEQPWNTMPLEYLDLGLEAQATNLKTRYHAYPLMFLL